MPKGLTAGSKVHDFLKYTHYYYQLLTIQSHLTLCNVQTRKAPWSNTRSSLSYSCKPYIYSDHKTSCSREQFCQTSCLPEKLHCRNIMTYWRK